MTNKMDKDNVVFLVFVAASMFVICGLPYIAAR
jgi:hypothetical protein